MRKTGIIAAVVSCLFLIMAAQAFAFGEIRYTDRPLNLREGRSPKARWVGNLYPGQKVRIAHERNGWAAVYEPTATDSSEGAVVGYSNVKYLMKKRTRYEPKDFGELVYTYRTLNVRTEPNIKSRKVTTLKAMTHVRIDFPDDDWVRVFPQNATIRSKLNGIGYSSKKYFRPATKNSLAKAAPSKPAPVVQPMPIKEPVVVVSDPEETVSGQGEVDGAVSSPSTPAEAPKPRFVTAKSLINVHADRTTGSKQVMTLKPGDTVQVASLKHGWYAVFSANELVLVESRVIGYALQSIVDKDTRTAEKQSYELGATSGSNIAPKAASASKSVPKSKAASPPRSKPVATASSGKQTLTIDRSQFTKAKKPDPTANKTAHGYQYRLLEKSETRQAGGPWITLKVFLSTTKLPTRAALKDFATTLWKENRRVTKNVVVLVYLPGMDTEDLAYGVIKYDDRQLLELWVRKATLFGTKFMK